MKSFENWAVLGWCRLVGFLLTGDGAFLSEERIFNVTGVMGGGVTIEGDNDRFCLGMRERFVDSFHGVGMTIPMVWHYLNMNTKSSCFSITSGNRLNVVCGKSLSGSVSVVVVVWWFTNISFDGGSSIRGLEIFDEGIADFKWPNRNFCFR